MVPLDHGFRQLRRRIRLVASLILACGAGLSIGATDGPDDAEILVVDVRDDQGESLTTGSVLFCPEDAPCVEFGITNDGTIRLPLTLLIADAVYSVLIYDEDLSLRYAVSEWRYDSTVSRNTPAALTGLPAQGLQVSLPPAAVPAATAATGVAAANGATTAASDASARDARFLGAVTVPFMLGGNFGTDPDALGGVTDVYPGIGLTGSYRFGFPRHRTLGGSSVTFKELSLAYAQNRYHTDPIQPTGDGSDLTFHRFNLAFGLGRQWQRSQGVLAVAAGYGGLYDGSTVVEFRDRKYSMFGLGLRAQYIYGLFGKDAGVSVGLLGQLEAMYYFADPGEDDHWYGWAPSVSIGVAVY